LVGSQPCNQKPECRKVSHVARLKYTVESQKLENGIVD